MGLDPMEMAVQARDMARDATSGIASHEEICAVRYASIDSRLKNLEGFQTKLTWMMFGTLVSSIGGLVLLLVQLKTGR